MPGAVDISMIGDKALERMFKKLPDKMQEKVAKPALRKSAVRLRGHVVSELRRQWPKARKLAAVLASTKPRKYKARSLASMIIYGLPLPGREELRIGAKDKGYYPLHLEYGAKEHVIVPKEAGGLLRLLSGELVSRVDHPGVQAKPYIRPGVDKNKRAEWRLIGKEIGKRIEKEARKLGKAAAK